jgi:hypothetical protein
MEDHAALAAAFQQDMLDAAEQCVRELGYRPGYWLRMISDHGAVDATKRLLRGPRASDGFTRLWEEGRLDLSAEFFVLLPRYEPLFTQEERAEARRRLELYDFDVDRYLAEHAAGRNSKAPGPSASVDSPPPAAPQAAESPVVRAVVTPGAENTIWPTLADLQRAHAVFSAQEPRDVFYRAATDLVALTLAGKSSLTVSEALAILLQTWNRAYYQYQRPKMADHYQELDEVLARHREWLRHARDRTIDSLVPADEPHLQEVFADFEAVLGPVGAAKALHLLAPRFLPLWDNAIAVAYGVQLGKKGTNASRYVRFLRTAKEQCARLGGQAAAGDDVLKRLDEYNYCTFSKGWM